MKKRQLSHAGTPNGSTVSDRILQTIEKHNMIRPGMHIVTGLSGGPDSVCLFDFLCRASETLGITLSAVHVDHMLRGADSDADREYVERLCEERGVPLTVVRFDCAEEAKALGVSTEEAGRNRRYRAFRDAAAEIESSGVPNDMIAVATAHHADDRAETVLMRIIRGTGPDGLAGIDYVRDDGEYRIIRPLLDITKADITGYCDDNGLSPRTDDTNLEPVYTRNAVRLELIPELEKFNPNVREALIRLAEAAREDRDEYRQRADKFLADSTKSRSAASILLDGNALRELMPPLRKRVMISALRSIGMTEDMTAAGLEACEYILMEGGPSSQADLARGYKVSRVYDDIRFMAPSKGVSKPAACTENCGAKGYDMRVSLVPASEYEEAGMTRGMFAAFDADDMERIYGQGFVERIKLRTRMPGDRILTKAGTKKLQDLFVDRKIPREERDSVPLAAIGNDVLFIPVSADGNRRAVYSADGFVKETSKNVLLIEIFCAL